MSQTTNADDTHTRGRFDTSHMDGIEHGRSTAHQRPGVFVADAIRNAEEEGLTPDSVASKRPLVLIVDAIHLAIRTHGLPAAQAVFASFATVVFITPANTVTFLEILDIGTGGGHGPGSFMAQAHVSFPIVNIGKTDAGMGDFDQDLIIGQIIFVGGSFADGTIGGTLEHGEIVAHDGDYGN